MTMCAPLCHLCHLSLQLVVLSQQEKEVIDDQISHSSFPLRGSRIIARCGDPFSSQDIANVSAEHAR